MTTMRDPERVDELVFCSACPETLAKRLEAFCEAIAPWFPDAAQLWPRVRTVSVKAELAVSDSMSVDLGRGYAGENPCRRLFVAAVLWTRAQLETCCTLTCYSVTEGTMPWLVMAMRIGRKAITKLILHGDAVDAWPSLEDAAGESTRLPCWPDMAALQHVVFHMDPGSMRWWVACIHRFNTPNAIHLCCHWDDCSRRTNTVGPWNTRFPPNIVSLTLINYNAEMWKGLGTVIKEDCAGVHELVLVGGCTVVGEAIGGLVGMLHGLPQLRRLSIDHSDIFAYLTTAISRMSGLEMLALSQITFSDNVLYGWPDVGPLLESVHTIARRLPNLRDVTLSQFSDDNYVVFTAFVASLRHCPLLRRFTVISDWCTDTHWHRRRGRDVVEAISNGPLAHPLTSFHIGSDVHDLINNALCIRETLNPNVLYAITSRLAAIKDSITELGIGNAVILPRRLTQLTAALDALPHLVTLKVPISALTHMAPWCRNRNINMHTPFWSWTVVSAGIMMQQEKRISDMTRRPCAGLSIVAYTPASVLRRIGSFLRVVPLRIQFV